MTGSTDLHDPGPLDGIAVLDLSILGLGGIAGVALADLGADVVKLESIDGGDPARGMQFTAGEISCAMPDGRNVAFELFNRGKRGIQVDLKSAQGQAVAVDLANRADVVIENFRPGVTERFGLDYASLKEANPRLVYASASGYGPQGPQRERPGLDNIGQTRSGYMWTMGKQGDPPMLQRNTVADVMGSIMLTQGVLAGLAGRATSGKGCLVETSHLGAMMWLQYWNIGAVMFSGAARWPRFRREEMNNPLWNSYECSDGEWITLAFLQSDRHWPGFCQIIERPEFEHDPRFLTWAEHGTNCIELVSILDSIFKSRPSDEWMKLLGTNEDFVFDRVQSVNDLPLDPQVMANDYLMQLNYGTEDQRRAVRLPFHFDGNRACAARLAPGLGEHTWEVLDEWLQYDSDKIEQLLMAGVIG